LRSGSQDESARGDLDVSIGPKVKSRNVTTERELLRRRFTGPGNQTSRR
jgi:hypothetical protein